MNNTFGRLFRITTWGESHGKAIGVVIDGCPAGLRISEKEIHQALQRRKPGTKSFTSTRQEDDRPEILSGIFEGKTTGMPISIIIRNKDILEDRYSAIKDVLRPGHANYSYLKKYGIFDYAGGGRASARETACRVAAGAIASKILKRYSIKVIAYVQQIGDLVCPPCESDLNTLQKRVAKSPIFCPNEQIAEQMIEQLAQIRNKGDSLGGIITFTTSPLPVGLGNPVYEKLEARIADALMSIPGSKGVEIGSGFNSVNFTGFSHNDRFIKKHNHIVTETNHSGGTLGGISYGMPLQGRVAFKPTSGIMLEQPTLTVTGEPTVMKMPPNAKHDPCIAVRAVPVVEAMISLVLTDLLLLKRSDRL